jgi:hypothetical protein
VGLLAIDLEFDDRVGVSRLSDMLELEKVERDRDRVDAVTEDDGRDLACLAQVGNVLADLGPAGRG